MAADGASSAPEPGATRRARGRDAGYLAATSIRYGAATPHGRYALPRIAVYWGESLATFGQQDVRGGRPGALTRRRRS